MCTTVAPGQVRSVRENSGMLVAWLLQNYLKQMDQFLGKLCSYPISEPADMTGCRSRFVPHIPWKAAKEAHLLSPVNRKCPASRRQLGSW